MPLKLRSAEQVDTVHVSRVNRAADIIVVASGRRGDLMASAQDLISNGPGSSPGRGTALCSWARYRDYSMENARVRFLFTS